MGTSAQTVEQVPFVRSFQLELESVESGVGLAVLTDFLQQSGLEPKDIYDIVIPARTLTHRRAQRKNLSRDETDKLARVARLYDQALSVFGDTEKALRFLRKPKRRFDGRTPLQMMKTEMGGRLVEAMLWGIADGVFV